MPEPFNQIYPNQAIAICSRKQAAQLVNYDHHLVSRLIGMTIVHQQEKESS